MLVEKLVQLAGNFGVDCGPAQNRLRANLHRRSASHQHLRGIAAVANAAHAKNGNLYHARCVIHATQCQRLDGRARKPSEPILAAHQRQPGFNIDAKARPEGIDHHQRIRAGIFERQGDLLNIGVRAQLHEHRHVHGFFGRAQRINNRRDVVAHVMRGEFQGIGKRPHERRQFANLRGRISQPHDDGKSRGARQRVLFFDPLLFRQLRPQLSVQKSAANFCHAGPRHVGRLHRNGFGYEAARAAVGRSFEHGAVLRRRSRRRQNGVPELQPANVHLKIGHRAFRSTEVPNASRWSPAPRHQS